MFYKDERLALFIDGPNFYAAARSLGFSISFKLVHEEFKRRGRLISARYYIAVPEEEEHYTFRPALDWMHYNGFALVTKTIKEYTDRHGQPKTKGNMSVDLTVDALELAQRVDHIVLFSGNGDFCRLVEGLQRQAVRVSVVSTIRSESPMISDELRRQADNFIELEELKEVIASKRERSQAEMAHT